jgi:signal transduction histidine kinase
MEKLDPKSMLGYLCASAGHHIINSFSTVVSQAEILRSLVGSPSESATEVSERIETIIQTALDASKMTRRLIEIGHETTAVEREQPGYRSTQIRLDLLITDVVNAEQETYRSRAKFELALSSLPQIRGDAGALRWMLELLICNAVESLSEERGLISISTFTDDRGWLVMEVRDEGFGMDPEILEHAVDPFFSTKSGHAGVGLTIARGIWRRHRGTMAINSQPERGTTIRLSVAPPESRLPDE